MDFSSEERVQLPAVLAPRVAIALLTQQTVRGDAPVPDGFEERRNMKVARGLCPSGDPCGITFEALHAGFMCLRVPAVFTSAGAAGDYCVADKVELGASESDDDGSAPRRRMSVAVLFASEQGRHSCGWTALDALALLAEGGLAHVARLCVAAHRDARCVADAFGVELEGSAMVVRVADAEGAVRTTQKSLADMPSDRKEAACWILDTMVDAVSQESAVPALVNSRPTERPEATDGCFGRLWAETSDEFCRLAVAKPDVTRRAFGDEPLSSLVFSRDFVRLCPRDAPVNHGDVLHGLLLCASGADTEASVYVSENLEGVRPPRSEQKNRRLDLHVAVVNWSVIQLGAQVSLFGQRGVPGRPINAPRSSLLQLTPSIWPLNDHLCSAFRILPCSCASWRPTDEVLVSFSRKEAEMVHDLYVQQQAVQGPSLDLAADAETPLSRMLVESLPEKRSSERRLSLAGVGLRLDCAGCKIADAYTHAYATAPQSGVAQILLHGARVLGPKASVEDAFLLAASALKRRRVDGGGEGPSVSEAVMAALERASSSEDTASVVCDVDAHVLVRRLVAALQLKSADEQDKVAFDVPMGAASKAALIGAVRRRTKLDLADLAPLDGNEHEDAAGALARASARLQARDGLFVFELRKHCVAAYLVHGGAAVRIVPDTVLSSADPTLVVVQHGRRGSKARVWRAEA